MSGSRKYPSELRERAVRMVAEVRGEYSSEWAAIESVAAKLGIRSAQPLLTGSAVIRSTRASARG
ncbi:hypothetical protein RE9425_18290 [Prescottella equi]|nr:hypothetical protein RE9425_18290 [Prescottella equi]